MSQEEEFINQTIDYYADYVDAPATPEAEPIPELTLESAEEEPAPEPVETVAQEEEPEIEPELEMEPILEAKDTPAEAEAEITEPLEMESEPELTLESSEETVPSAFDEESEELWADLIPEQKEEGQIVDEEAPIAFAREEEEKGPFGGSDFWDQVLEKDSQESQTAETEAVQQPVAPAPMPQNTAEREPSTDEELWKQAFPGEEELEPTASQYPGEEKEDSQSKVPPLVVGANVKMNEESEDSLEYDEAAYADDDDEFEFQRRKRKLGPFTIPHGRRGDWIIGGAMVVFLLLAGSVYLTLQTFAPGELTDMQTAKTEVPEGLTPREVPLDELVGGLRSPKPEKTPTVDTPGEKGEAILSDPSKILEESPEEKGILKDLAESQILKDTGKSQTAKIDQSALQALTGHSVTMSTIMPVAYNPTDIRVLSFSVEMQLSDAQSAKMVRESLPVYEEIMNRTVEDFLRRKFYNDVLYVKEKLQKRLQTAMNKSLKNGRVRKTKFTDFAIQ
jgi:flagellar basal body-associated protein FliL